MTTAELRAIIPRVIAKLEEEIYEDAIKIAETNTKVSNLIGPLRCYINYKLQKYQRVLDIYKVLHSNVQKELGMLHLLGQTHYKLGLKNGNFTESVSIYHQIGELYPFESLQSSEYISNALAAYVNGFDIKKANNLLEKINFTSILSSKSTDTDILTYETLFNSSFVSMQQYNLGSALNLAEKAYDKFKIETENDVDVSEDALIQYHIAYIQRLQGDTNKFEQVTKHLVEDVDSFSVSVQLIFRLNSILSQLTSVTSTQIHIKNNDKIIDLIRRIELIKDEQYEKLSKIQLNLINFNLSIFHSLNKSIDSALKNINFIPTDRIIDINGGKNITTLAVPNSSIISIDNNDDIGISGFNKEWLQISLQIYVFIKEKEYTKCDELLSKFLSTINVYLSQDSTHNYIIPYYINTMLTRVFISLFRHQINNAITILKKLTIEDTFVYEYLVKTKQITNNLKFNQQPALLALMITLYEESKDYKTCAEVIDMAIDLYQNNKILSDNDQETSRILTQLRIKNATVKASSGDYIGAINTLEMLSNNCNKNDKNGLDNYYHFISQIVSLCTQHCPELVSKYINLLPDPDLSDLSDIIDNFNDLEKFNLSVTITEPMMKKNNNKNNNNNEQFLQNGKHKFSHEKLKKFREKRKENRQKNPLLPKSLTIEQYNIAKATNFINVDPYRWKPKWERPQIASGKGGKKGTQKQQQQSKQQLGKGPQGSGVSESKVESNVVSAQTTAAEAKKQQIAAHLKNNPKNGKKGRK